MPRRSQRSKLPSGKSKRQTVVSYPKTTVAIPQSPFHDMAVTVIRRSCADVTIFQSVGGFNAALPPTFAGSSFWRTGTIFADSAAPTYNTVNVPFTIEPTLTCLGQYADMANLFQDYQILKAVLNVQLLCGESYNGGQWLPELLIYSDLNGLGPPADVLVAESHQTFRRTITTDRPISVAITPCPALLLYNGAVTNEYAQGRNLWLNTNSSSDLVHYAFSGMIRNFNAISGSGLIIRANLELTIGLRRPH
jgi:hypothetical protein